MSCDDDGPAPSPSAAVLARRASREAKSMREESKVCRRASRQRRERELTAEIIQKYICTLYTLERRIKQHENPRPLAAAKARLKPPRRPRSQARGLRTKD
jgi:hypothetical protein